jgi:hypothetical protein
MWPDLTGCQLEGAPAEQSKTHKFNFRLTCAPIGFLCSAKLMSQAPPDTHRAVQELVPKRLPIIFPVCISCRTFVELCTRNVAPEIYYAAVLGFTTRTLHDAGGASIRIAFNKQHNAIEHGAYMCAVRGERGWLAALIAIRRTSPSLASTAEVMVFGQPIRPASLLKGAAAIEFAPLSESTHGKLFPLGSTVCLRAITRIRPFSAVHSVGANWLVQLLCQLASEADNACRGEVQTSAAHGRDKSSEIWINPPELTTARELLASAGLGLELQPPTRPRL